MKSTPFRILKVLLIVIVSISVILVIAGRILTSYAEKAITEKLKEVNGNIESIEVNLFTRSIHAKKLQWTSVSDSVNHAPHQVHIETISVSGIGIFNYLFNKKISISKILIENGDITYDQAIKTKDKAGAKSPVTKIGIDELVIKNIRAKITNDTIQEYSGKIDITLRGIQLLNFNNPPEQLSYKIKSVDVLAEQLVMHGKTSLYKTSISRLSINSAKQEIKIDSLSMDPTKGKYEFANSLGRQKTRVVLQIPKIEMKGFDFEQLGDSIFSVSKIEVQNADLSVFRDKRLPFKNPYIPLPMEMLRDIHFGIKIDSINISKAKIVHEEMAEQGVESGKINFTDLNASISNFNNRIYSDRPDVMIIRASSKFMKSGFIDATFHFPVKKGVDYKAQGKIIHLDLREINTITETVAFVRVESGLMNRLNFNFHYNDLKSKGVLDISYENLVMTGLNKKDKKHSINQFKTFLINTVIKNDKDKNTPKENRTGEIDIDRDRHRFVVNLWVKSLFDGLKSVVLPNTQEKKK